MAQQAEELGDPHNSISVDDSTLSQQVIAVGEKTPGENPVAPFSEEANSVNDRIFELTELGANNDDESFRKIIASLSDTNPEIREAALEATIQFGSRDAVPILKELATTLEDAEERVRMLDAAKFLALPSFSEIRAQRRSNLNSEAISKRQN